MSWGKRLSLPAREFIVQMGLDFGRPPDDFTDCMAFETGETFSPSIRNPHSSGTGLIQFMDATCTELSKRWGKEVTTASLAHMTVEGQLSWVWKYFRMMIERVGKPQSLEDVYMLIYWPSACGKPLDTRLHSKGTSMYGVNSGLDVDKDGVITKREAGQLVRAKSAKGRLFSNFG